MNAYKLALVALIIMVISPWTTAQIYKCDGPDGPVYTDRVCGPDAERVELSETSGLSGVSDETKAELAAKKADRELAREEERKRNSNSTVINNQYTTINTEPAGRWLYPRPWRPIPERPEKPVVTPKPLPSTLGRPRN